jgi:cation/acetate symporter
MGFVSAVAFATILAVVAGLMVAGSAAVSHDLYANLIKKDNDVGHKREIRLTRQTTVVLGVVSILLGEAFQHQSVAAIATLPMVVAASVNFPVLILALYWSGLTTRGSIVGATVGLISSIGLIVMGPSVWVAVLGFAQPLFPYDYPALFTMPLAFLGCVVVSRLDRSRRSGLDRAGFMALSLKSEEG